MAKELIYKVRIDYDASSASSGGNAIERSQEGAQNAVNETTQAIRRQQEAQESTTQSTRNYNRAQSNANQVLFSYGDLLNDAQQFQFGFSNGLRAIGNNIGFAAEGLSNLNTRAGGFTGTLKALGSSLLGPGGIILAINAAVTAFTVFGDSLFGTDDSVASKAEKAREELKETRKEIDRFSIQFEQLSSLQEEAFPDLDRSEQLQQQLQFARELEGNLQNRLDAQKELVSSIEEDVENESRLLEILQSNRNVSAQVQEARSEGLVTQRQAESILQGRVDLQATINTLQNQLNNSQNELVAAKERQSSLEQSVQSAQERQIQLGAKVEELSAGRATSTFKALQNLIGQNRELGFILQAQQRLREAGLPDLTASAQFDVQGIDVESETDAISRIANKTAELPEAFANASQRIEQIKQNEVQTRISLEQQALTTISSLAQAIAPRNRALALSLIAIEKGLKIAQVVADGTAKAAAATSQGILFSASPFTAPLAAQAFSAAAAIKANTAASVAAIAAQGLAEGITAATRIGGRGGGGGGGQTQAAQSYNQVGQLGINRNNLTRNNRVQGIQSGRRNEPQPIIIQGNVNDVAAAFTVRKGEAKIRRKQQG